MGGVTERLANLNWQTVIIIIVVLLAIRYALLRTKWPAARSIAEIAESLAIAMGLVFLIIRPFFVQAFFIPSPSMVPTLLVHDHILVNKTVYRMRDPKPGEVIVFKAPPEALRLSGQFEDADTRQVDYIKRVIGVPGDEVFIRPGYIVADGIRYSPEELRNILVNESSEEPEEMRLRIRNDGVYLDGRRISDEVLSGYLGNDRDIEYHPGYVVRNGHRLPEHYLADDPDSPYPIEDPTPGHALEMATVRNLEEAMSDGKIELVRDGGPLRVKLLDGVYLMMGDNRNHSLDSRYWGPLDRERVVGRAMFIFWPFGRVQWVR